MSLTRETPSRKRGGSDSAARRIPLVGRAGLLEALARRARPATIVLGEMGAGKSRLLAESRELLAGTPVFSIACERGAALLPLEPLVGLVRALHRDGFVPTPMKDAVVGAAERDRLSFIREALETVARQPVVFQIDDLHWADRATPDALRYCIDRLQDVPIKWQLTSRLASVDVESFAYDLERAQLGEVLTLDGLTLEELGHFASIIGARGSLDGGALQRLYERTAGNPLYAELLLSSDCLAGPEIPRTLRWALHERLATLSVEAADIAAWISVHRGPLQQGAIAGLSRYSPAQVLTALTELMDKGIVRRSHDGYSFRHELLLDVCYESMHEEARAKRHEALAERTIDEWQRAGHYDGARRYEEAAAILIRIGWDRLDREMPNEAITAFERGIERLNPDGDAAWEARAGLAAASYAAGKHEDAHTRMREFEDRAASLPARLRVLARGRFAEAVWNTSVDVDIVIPTVEAAIAEARTQARDMLPRLLGVLGGAIVRKDRLEEARAALEEALGYVDAGVHQREEVRLRAWLGVIHARLGNAREGIARLEAAAERAEALGLSRELTLCCTMLCYVCDMAADIERYERWCRKGLAVAGPKPRRSQALLLNNLAYVGVDKGRLQEALGLCIASLAIAEPSSTIAVQSLIMQANLYSMLGDVESARRAIADARTRKTPTPWLGAIEFAAGHVEELYECYADALSCYQRVISGADALDEVYQVRALAYQVRIAFATGDRRLGQGALTRLRAANRHGWAVIRRLLLEAEGWWKLLCGESDAACDDLLQAAAEEPDKFYQARLRLTVADRRGDRAMFLEVIDALDALGAVRAADKARALARGHGLRPGRKREQHGGLSERELAVAHLVASGKTNSEIGEQLHVSPRTVEFHLGNILGKCGLRSRVEIAARIAAGTLIAPVDDTTTA